MQSDKEIYEAMNRLYNSPSTANDTRATLLVVSLLVDIRTQNAQIIKLLSGGK